jgi:hypothetical protein
VYLFSTTTAKDHFLPGVNAWRRLQAGPDICVDVPASPGCVGGLAEARVDGKEILPIGKIITNDIVGNVSNTHSADAILLS